jgi:lysophospholipase L1-like esterase
MGSDYPSITARATCAGVLHNYAVSASRMVDLIDREAAVDIAYRVDAWNVLVVLAGSNDLADGADPVALHGAVAAYLARRRARGYVTVALTVPPRVDVAEGPRQAFNALLRASERVADVSEASIPLVDGIHPGEEGFATMAGIVADAIRPLAPVRCPLPWARVTRPHPPAAE